METQTIRRCEKCGSDNLTMLFIHYICNVCEPPPPSSIGGSESVDGLRNYKLDPTQQGYVVWRSRPPGSCEYVFQTREDATRWRAAAGLDRFPIRQVGSTGSSFRWRMSTGSVRDIVLADRLFEIFPDATHEPGPNRAYLEP